jgi:HSP20 family molecular chaperone IbpA
MTLAVAISPASITDRSVVDIHETVAEIAISARIPQIDPENLDIKVSKHSILLWGEQMERVKIEGYCDFSYPALQFHKIVPLAHAVVPESIQVDIQQTNLRITLAKDLTIDESEFSLASGVSRPEML